MTYIEDWDDFRKAAEALYMANPQTTRMVTKYRHKDARLVVKVTDDHVCVKYRTNEELDVKRLDKLSTAMMSHMLDDASSSSSAHAKA
eukprot:Nk52_evm1s2645 gene=Nk52_evmTU1s2645